MKPCHILFALLMGCQQLLAQEQFNKVFDVTDLDWGSRTLGQYDRLNSASAVEIEGWWYFPAYTPETGIDIWRTNKTIEGTEKFFEANAPTPWLQFGKYLIYNEYDGDYYTLWALDLDEKRTQSLLNGANWAYNAFPVLQQWGNYLILGFGNDLVIQDLSKLPAQDVKRVSFDIPCRDIFNLSGDKILAFTMNAQSFLVDLKTGERSSINERLEINTATVQFAGRLNNKYYLHYQPALYTSSIWIETDLNFSKASIRTLGTYSNAAILMLTGNHAILSNFVNGRNTFDLIDLPSGNLQKRIVTDRTTGSYNWDNLYVLPDGGYLSTYSNMQSPVYFNFDRNIYRYIEIENPYNEFIHSINVMEKGLLVGFPVQPGGTVGMFYFEYQTLNPQAILPNKSFSSDFGRILKPVYAILNAEEILTLLYDEEISYEPAILNVKTKAFFYLKDFNSESLGVNALINQHEVLSNGLQALTVSSGETYMSLLLDAEKKEITHLSEWYGGRIILADPTQDYSWIGLPGASPLPYSVGANIVEFKNLVYFIGWDRPGDAHSLFVMDISAQSIQKLVDVPSYARIFATENHLYLLQTLNEQLNVIPRNLFRLEDEVLIPVFLGDELTRQDYHNLHQYYFFNNKLLFSEKSNLLAFDEQTGNIDTLFKAANLPAPDPWGASILTYRNFVVKDNELYFTVSVDQLIYFWGVIFLGVAGPLDFQFLKTDGTSSGTIALSGIPVNVEEYYNNHLNMFSLNGNLLLSTRPADQSEAQLFVWGGTEWNSVNVSVNGIPQTVLPIGLINQQSFKHRIAKNLVQAENNTNQDIPLVHDGEAFFYDLSLPPNEFGFSYINLLKTQFNGTALSISTKPFYVEGFDHTQFYYYFRNLEQINSRLISLNNINGFTSINEYNFKTGRSRNVCKSSDGLISSEFPAPTWLQADPARDVAYFATDQKNSYGTKQIFRINTCPEIAPSSGIQTISDSICFGEPWQLAIDDVAAGRWLFFEVDSNTVPSNFTNEAGIWSHFLALETGTFVVNIFIDNGCDSIFLGTKTLTIVKDSVNTPDISSAPLVGNIINYFTTVEADNYIWSVTNGTILFGQNTPEIRVDWGVAEQGSVTITLENGLCKSESATLQYVKPTSTFILEKQDFKLFPNPARFELNIELPRDINGASVRIHSLDGKILQEDRDFENEIQLDMSNYMSGVYVIEVMTQYGSMFKKAIVIK